MSIEISIDAHLDYRRYLSDFNVGMDRQRKNVMYRNAYAVALSIYLGPSDVGRITSRNHATIIYAKSVHDINMRYDETYIKAYAHCRQRLKKLLNDDGSVGDLYHNKTRIELYELIRDKDEEILELRLELYRAKEYRQQQEALQGVQ